MTATIDAGVDYNPIDITSAPDFSSEQETSYMRSMDGAAPTDLKVQIAQLFYPIQGWWETAAQTATIAYQTVRDMAAGQDKLWGETAGSKAIDVMADPTVRLYLVSKYYGRGIAADQQRQYWMHRLMDRRLVVIGTALNATRIYLRTVVTNLESAILRTYATERNDRKTAESNIVKLVFAVKDQVVQNLQQWTKDEIAYPILKEIANVHTITQGETARSIAVDHGKIIAELAPLIAAVAATQVAQQVQINKLMTENDTCVQPMCETQGPNSPLGRLFDSLKAVKWLAILAALETTDIKTLERLANAVAGTEGEVGDWVGTKILDELNGAG